MTSSLSTPAQDLTPPTLDASAAPSIDAAQSSGTFTLADAIGVFERKNLAVRIPVANPKEGEPLYTSYPASRCKVIFSHVRNGLRCATGREGDVDDVDLAPYMATLPELAHRDAVHNGRSNPANEASSVRTFLRAVDGRRNSTGPVYKRRVRPESFVEWWRPLRDVLMDHPVEGDRYRRYLGWLESVQNVALINGVRDPAALPDYATLKAWMLQAGHSEKAAQDLFVAYRTARELAKLPQLPALEPPARDGVRGLRSLPDLDDRIQAACVRLTIEVRRHMQEEVRARGYGAAEAAAAIAAAQVICTARAPEMRTLDILDYLAPEIAHHTRQYVEWTRTATTKSNDWRDEVESAAGCAVAELLRLGEDPFMLDHLDLFLERRTIQRTTTTVQTAHRSRRAVNRTGTEQVSLFRLLLDAMARRSVPHSQLYVPAEQARESVPFYPPAVFNNKSALWAVTQEVYGRQLGRAAHEETAEEWRDIEREFDRVSRHLKEHNQARDIDGHVNKGLLPANLGAVVCVGLRDVWLRVRALRTAWHLAYEKHGQNADAAPVRAARSRYLRELEPWAIAALRLDDGMRGKQYVRGRLNVNFFLEGPLDPKTKRLTAVTGLRVYNEGFDRVAGTKKRKTASGRKRERARRCLPGIVDMELMTDFIFELRLDRLVARGLVPSREGYDPATDQFALFVSPPKDQRRRRVRLARKARSVLAPGGYTEPVLSRKFGKVLHYICRDVLKLRDNKGQPIPSWDELRRDLALRRRWRAVFRGHMSRALITTFLGGVLKDWDLAAFLTNDSLPVLMSYYHSLDALMKAMQEEKGINHPEHCVAVYKRLLAGEIIDWVRFDPARPETARTVQRHRVVPPPTRIRAARREV